MLKHFLLDLVKYYKTITKFAGNPLTSSLPTSLPPTSLLLTVSKKFNYCYASISFKRQINKIII